MFSQRLATHFQLDRITRSNTLLELRRRLRCATSGGYAAGCTQALPQAGHDGAEQADALALDLIDHLVDQIQERNRSKKPSKKKCKDLIKELENFLNGGNSTSVQARQCYKLRTTYRCPWMLLMRSVRQSSGSPLFDSTGCHTQPAPHPLTVAREPGDARTT